MFARALLRWAGSLALMALQCTCVSYCTALYFLTVQCCVVHGICFAPMQFDHVFYRCIFLTCRWYKEWPASWLACAILCAQYPVTQSPTLLHEACNTHSTDNSWVLHGSSACILGTAYECGVASISLAMTTCKSVEPLQACGLSSVRCGWQGRVSDAHSRGEAACAQLQSKLDQSGAALQMAATNQKELEKQKRAVDKKLVRALSQARALLAGTLKSSPTLAVRRKTTHGLVLAASA